MVNVGCVAKLLGTLQLGSSYWVKRVNPYWYEAREVPKTLLSERRIEESSKMGERSRRRIIIKKADKHYMQLARL